MRKRSASRFCPRTRLFTDPISGLQLFLYVQASEFACLPGRSYRCKFPCRAAEAFTSELSVHRCLCTHRTYYPPDNRQLAERGLTPRKIHSIVDCSSPLGGLCPVAELSPAKGLQVAQCQGASFCKTVAAYRKAGRQQVSVLACGLSPAWHIAYSSVLHPQVCTRCHPKGSRICEDRRKAFQQT